MTKLLYGCAVILATGLACLGQGADDKAQEIRKLIEVTGASSRVMEQLFMGVLRPQIKLALEAALEKEKGVKSENFENAVNLIMEEFRKELRPKI
jgi:hypothetical protein